ncbi:molybdopterin-guanine dinucleotide biosynthesis protein A [Sulfolobales archaeon HS-7]|nr:molybdopterin-guanine dinucleotide biosynthesis protein A [Sulfolobales archaeon HS-7]
MSDISFDVIVLAGGESRRFGIQKCLYEISGVPMLVRICRELNEAIVVGNVEVKGYKCLEDDYSSAKCPMNGIRTGIKEVRKDKVFVTGCDFPYIKRKVAEKLCAKEAEASLVYYNGILQPLIGCYNRDVILRINNSECSPLSIIREARTVYLMGINELRLYDGQLMSLINVNTWDDLKPGNTENYWSISRYYDNGELVNLLPISFRNY